jgi:hypothetical protein
MILIFLVPGPANILTLIILMIATAFAAQISVITLFGDPESSSNRGIIGLVLDFLTPAQNAMENVVDVIDGDDGDIDGEDGAMDGEDGNMNGEDGGMEGEDAEMEDDTEEEEETEDVEEDDDMEDMEGSDV